MKKVLSSLPIDDVLDQLSTTLNEQAFAILVAAPGAGKTTRVPLALLDAEWRNDGRIIMLEPRRIAARAAAHRMAQSLGEKVGETVGYRVRLDTRVSAKTRIEVVTEGVFTRMILDDPELNGVAAVIFDEFHERSLDGDLGLALALDTAILRPKLRILIMSATLDSAQMSKLLADAPLIVSEGRAFPVETHYVPPKPNVFVEDHVVLTVLNALQEEHGSILVFLPGQAEIRRVAERLSSAVSDTIDIAPLYGRLTPEQQDRAIAPAVEGRRKIVIATSIAQTSLTIEGIRIVVDSGLARVPVYEPATALTRLETRTISQAAATQRQGRAGRTQDGVCYRLWSKGQNAAQAAFDTPEILSSVSIEDKVVIVDTNNPDELFALSDTLLDGFQQYQPSRQVKYFDYITLGEIGQPHKQLLYQPIIREGFDLGFHQFDLYLQPSEEVRFFDNPKPYTEAYYSSTISQEELLMKAIASIKLTKQINGAIDYQRINHAGLYQNSNNKHTNFSFNIILIFLFNALSLQRKIALLNARVIDSLVSSISSTSVSFSILDKVNKFSIIPSRRIEWV